MQVQRQIIDVRDSRAVLDLPASFVSHRVEVIALTVDEIQPPQPRHRVSSPTIFGTDRTPGDIDSPIVDPADFSSPL